MWITMSDTNSTTDSEYKREDDGRSVEIDTGYYHVHVWGDTEDSFEAVMDKAEEAAKLAKHDVIDLDDRMDTEEPQFR
jgi:hypothetical protein